MVYQTDPSIFPKRTSMIRSPLISGGLMGKSTNQMVDFRVSSCARFMLPHLVGCVARSRDIHHKTALWINLHIMSLFQIPTSCWCWDPPSQGLDQLPRQCLKSTRSELYTLGAYKTGVPKNELVYCQSIAILYTVLWLVYNQYSTSNINHIRNS